MTDEAQANEDAACYERKQAFDEWYFALHSVYPDLLNRPSDRDMWIGFSAGFVAGKDTQ